jgi:hypothetical protein
MDILAPGQADGHEHLLEWLRSFGRRFSAGRREKIDVLPDGRARLVVVYPSLNALLAVLQEIDVVRAMLDEETPSEGQGASGSVD